MILVTGATGIAGSQVVRALLRQAAGRARVRARPGQGARPVRRRGRARAPATSPTPRSLRAALDGAEALFLSGADDPRRVDWETAAIDAAAEAGVRRIVKLSSIVARAGSAGRVLGLARPDRAAPDGSRGPCGDPALELLHVEPARRSRARGSRRQALRAGGRGADRDDRSPRCRRRRGGRPHLGRPRRPVVRPDRPRSGHLHAGRRKPSPRQPVARSSSSTSPTRPPRRDWCRPGLPAFAAEQIVAIFAQARLGVAAQVTATVEPLTGRPPRDFAAFARDSANLFSRRRKQHDAHRQQGPRPPRVRGRDPRRRCSRDA